MTFRGRTVVGLMLFALVAGGLLTLTIVETLSSALPIEEQPSDVAGSLPDGTENGQAGPDGGGTSANRTLTGTGR